MVSDFNIFFYLLQIDHLYLRLQQHVQVIVCYSIYRFIVITRRIQTSFDTCHTSLAFHRAWQRSPRASRKSSLLENWRNCICGSTKTTGQHKIALFLGKHVNNMHAVATCCLNFVHASCKFPLGLGICSIQCFRKESCATLTVSHATETLKQQYFLSISRGGTDICKTAI